MENNLIIVQPKLGLEEPHNCTDSKDILTIHSAIFDTLICYNKQMRYAPSLAQSWTVENNARTWTFHLRQDVQFHNGDICDAAAVKYSLERMARPDMGVTLGAPGVYHQYLSGMHIDIVDQYTIRLTTATPTADLLDILVTGYILLPEATERLGSNFKNSPIGSGPYQFVEYADGNWLRVKRNERYRQFTPPYTCIEWKFVSDPNERVQLVKDGQAHIAATLPPDVVAEAPHIHFVRSQGPTAYIIMFRANKGPLQNPLVRLALNLGIDRQQIIDEVLGGAGYPLTGFVSPFHFGANQDRPSLHYDPERAKALLQQAGYSNGLTLMLNSPTSLPNEAVSLSKAVTKQLRHIGVNVETVYTEDRVAYAHQVRLKDIHDMCIFDSSPLSTFRVLKEKIDARFAGSWWQGYHHEEVEMLLDQAQSTPDEAAREAVYRQCYDLLTQDPPWLYLYNHQIITGMSSQLADWHLPHHGVIDPRFI